MRVRVCYGQPSMRLSNRTLDRIWLLVVATAFTCMAPLWVAIWYERHPLLGLVQAALIVRYCWLAITDA